MLKIWVNIKNLKKILCNIALSILNKFSVGKFQK